MKPVLYLLSLLVSSALAEVATPIVQDKKPPEELPEPTVLPVNWDDTIIEFSWCRQWNSSNTCGSQKLRHGQCCKHPDLAYHKLVLY